MKKSIKAICTALITAMVIASPTTYAKPTKKIPDAFTKGLWISMPTAKLEKGLCAKDPNAESDMMMIYEFNTNSFTVGYYEGDAKFKIVSLTEATPNTLKGKVQYIEEDERGRKKSKTKNVAFTIKNNRLYSTTEFNSGYDSERALKSGLYYCPNKKLFD